MAKKDLGTELGTILITAFAIFSWIALFTYHSQDPSFFTQSTEHVLNSCGSVGASLSSLLLQFFGLASFFVPLGFLFVAARIHSSDGIARALSSLFGLSLSVISLTVFLSLHWRMWHWSGTQFLTGGVLGAWLSLPLERALQFHRCFDCITRYLCCNSSHLDSDWGRNFIIKIYSCERRGFISLRSLGFNLCGLLLCNCFE